MDVEFRWESVSAIGSAVARRVQKLFAVKCSIMVFMQTIIFRTETEIISTSGSKHGTFFTSTCSQTRVALGRPEMGAHNVIFTLLALRMAAVDFRLNFGFSQKVGDTIELFRDSTVPCKRRSSPTAKIVEL